MKLILRYFDHAFINWQSTVFGSIGSAVGSGVILGFLKPNGDINWAAVGLTLLGSIFSGLLKDARVTGVGAAAKTE